MTFNGAAAQAFNPAGSTLQNVTINADWAGDARRGRWTSSGTLTLTSGTLAAWGEGA